MLKIATRFVFIAFGLYLILDAVLPNRVEHVAVDRHQILTSRDTSRSQFETKHYTLKFDRGSIGSCDVGYSLYSRLNDGDEIEVSATKLMKRCSRITQNGTTVYSEGFAWYLSPLAGLAAILAALGVLGLDQRLSIRL